MFSAVYGRGSWEEVFGEVVPAGFSPVLFSELQSGYKVASDKMILYNYTR